MIPSEQDFSNAPQADSASAVWPPRPTVAEATLSEAEIAIQKALDTAQKYFTSGWLFYPLYIVAMVYGLKANRLGANGRGTKYIVAGSLYLAFVAGLALYITYMIVMHPHR